MDVRLLTAERMQGPQDGAPSKLKKVKQKMQKNPEFSALKVNTQEIINIHSKITILFLTRNDCSLLPSPAGAAVRGV